MRCGAPPGGRPPGTRRAPPRPRGRRSRGWRTGTRAREAGDDLHVAAGIRPVRVGTLAARARLEQPGRPGVDHPVDEELRRAGAPPPAAAVAERELRLDLLVGDARLQEQRDDAAQRQVAAGLELVDPSNSAGVADHHVPAGEAEGVQARSVSA